MQLIQYVLDNLYELETFSREYFDKFDYTLSGDYFNYIADDVSFSFEDMVLRVFVRDKNQYLQIDIDTNAFWFNFSTPPVLITTGAGTYLYYQNEKHRFRLRNVSNLDVNYDPKDYLTDETNFQGSTIMSIPGVDTLTEICEVGEYMLENTYKLRSTIPFELWNQIPFEQYFDSCSYSMENAREIHTQY